MLCATMCSQQNGLTMWRQDYKLVAAEYGPCISTGIDHLKQVTWVLSGSVYSCIKRERRQQQVEGKYGANIYHQLGLV